MKIATSLKKLNFSKSWGPVKPPFLKIWMEVQPSPSRKFGGGSTLLCFGIWWFHEIWKSKILKFDFLENEKNLWSKKKNFFFLIEQVLSLRLKKQSSKNVADTAFNVKQVKQKPFEVCITWKVFLEFYIFPGCINHMLLVILFTINTFTYYNTILSFLKRYFIKNYLT